MPWTVRSCFSVNWCLVCLFAVIYLNKPHWALTSHISDSSRLHIMRRCLFIAIHFAHMFHQSLCIHEKQLFCLNNVGGWWINSFLSCMSVCKEFICRSGWYVMSMSLALCSCLFHKQPALCGNNIIINIINNFSFIKFIKPNLIWFIYCILLCHGVLCYFLENNVFFNCHLSCTNK